MVIRTTAAMAKLRLSHVVNGKSEPKQQALPLEPLRHQFWNGQNIPLHRALRRLTPRQSDALSVLIIPFLANFIMLMFWEDLRLFLLGALFFFLDPLIDPLRFAAYDMPGLTATLSVPRINSLPPTPGQWWVGFWVCAACLLLAAMPIKSLIGLRFFAGFFGVIQLASQLYFAVGIGALAVNPQDYLVDSMQLSVYWIWFTPWLLGLTFNLFPFSQAHKVRLTALAICHQLALFPAQFALQAFVLHVGSALWAAVLFFLIGLPFNVFITICFYGMGMAWPGIERDDQSRLKNS